MTNKTPCFSIFCIDYRFDALIADFYEDIGKKFDYYACTVAGGAMPLGYEKYCIKNCNSCEKNNKKPCNPLNSSMKLLKKNLIENLNIALTLNTIREVFLLNHQDCGAIKDFLACSGYPQTLGANNTKEIKINSKLLSYANEYILKYFPKMKYVLGFVDINGSVASYNISQKIWTVIHVGKYYDTKGTWYDMKVGDTLKI